MRRLIIAFAFVTGVGSNNLNARDIEVKNLSELNTAITSAKPGDVIVMADGIWNNTEINFSSAATRQEPVVIKAKTPGKVILTGSSTLQISKPYLIVDGLFFTNGSIKGRSVIEFKSDYGKLINTAIVDYNPANKSDSYYWVFFDGNHNRMERCFFKGKNHMQPVIGNNQDNSRYNSAVYCHFKDIPYSPENGREIFRIWGYGRSEETGEDGAFFTIENNFFERAHGEGMEIISLKSNRNLVRYNVIENTKGGIVGRSGNFNTIESNYIFGKNEAGSSGIRLAGQGHKVVNNYVSDVSGDGLILISGEYIDTALTPLYEPILRAGTPLGRVPRYGHVKNGLFANNTFVNIGETGINIGASYNPNPGADQRMLIPENNRIVNNILIKTNGGTGVNITAPGSSPLLQRFKFAPNILEGNIVFGATQNSVGKGILVVNPKLILKDGMFRPSSDSPAIDNGLNISLKEDIDGQLRGSKPDIGADEVSLSSVNRKPVTANNTGPKWVVDSRNSGNIQF